MVQLVVLEQGRADVWLLFQFQEPCVCCSESVAAFPGALLRLMGLGLAAFLLAECLRFHLKQLLRDYVEMGQILYVHC